MADRDQILIDLVKQVLGPRGGPDEVLPAAQDPRTEYITGVLVPAAARDQLERIEAEVDELGEEVSAEEDLDNPAPVVVPGLISPALDPKALPRSIGLSFSVYASDRPEIEICCTWARYHSAAAGWQRVPAFYLSGTVRADRHGVEPAAPGVALHVRSTQLPENVWRVSLFLVNATAIEGNPRTEDCLFQPQIRVKCGSDTQLIPVRAERSMPTADDLESPAAETAGLALLYSDRAALARGHLSAATWREIDPEGGDVTFPKPDSPPFIWVDREVVPVSERSKFSPPDVRTELVPCYPIEASRTLWDESWGTTPLLDPATLAETWVSERLRAALEPLVSGYRRWIAVKRAEIAQLVEAQRPIAEWHIRECEDAAGRMAAGIDVLASDDDARVAFCFANQAIALQSVWKRRPLTWYPFQLGFILLNIPALCHSHHQDRNICDLLWVPTGGGKTEAYLALVAFVLALRRRRAGDGVHVNPTGAGTAMLSRYTLRLLTIQQFRRAIGVITACEVLRVQGLDSPGTPVGWRPRAYPGTDSFLWGGARFSAGLWVGGGVTPNSLLHLGPMPTDRGMLYIAGALDILRGASREYAGPDRALRDRCNSARVEIEGEPAQMLTCPVCASLLAIPDQGLQAGRYTLHFVFQGAQIVEPTVASLGSPKPGVTITARRLTAHPGGNAHTLSISFEVPYNARVTPTDADRWWWQQIASVLGRSVLLLAARPARPGYFVLSYLTSQDTERVSDFEVFCPNPECELNRRAWVEQVPLARDATNVQTAGVGTGVAANGYNAELPVQTGLQWQHIPDWMRRGNSGRVAARIPIPACTIDDQIYHRCPSVVIATVDKFARLAFEPKASALSGNVTHYHSRWGFYREGCPPSSGDLPASYRPHPPGHSGGPLHVPVPAFAPPDLILQDELHLIEGPLGSMVGLYESAIDVLSQVGEGDGAIKPKYVASTATVRQAISQVKAVFNRRLRRFPPPALKAGDRFFATDREIHVLDSGRPGRLYVGVCAPGRGAQTPIVRIWSALIQVGFDLWHQQPGDAADRFWTLVGYFNALRELAGGLSLYRQDIPDWLRFMGQFRPGARVRPLEDPVGLSSRGTSSLDLPAMLERLEVPAPEGADAVLATSMFGTGVDVDRLGLMVVHGQPKTTAAYIQATGRIGRKTGGLVVTFLRASRPRDLDHYEFFTGYHRELYRHVEPITVAPFSARARERGLGPLAVILLRQAQRLNGSQVHPEWRVQQRLSGRRYHSLAARMGTHRHTPEVDQVSRILEDRARSQPSGRRPVDDATLDETGSILDRWQALAGKYPGTDRFVYHESSLLHDPDRHVVLGDFQHALRGLEEVTRNAPNSLRDVEETSTFQE